MSKSFYFISLNIGILFLFIQCQEASNTPQSRVTPADEMAKEVIEKKAVTEKKVDTTALVIKEITETSMDTIDTKVKPVTAKTAIVAEQRTVSKPEKKKTKKKVKKRAKIKFDQLVHKFGTIKTGDKVNHTFKFKNTGNAPLVIKNVDVSCGCTFPSYPFLPIEPGEQGAIDVTFDSAHKVGRQKPTVTVVTNGRPRIVKLNLEGFVE